MSKQESLTNAVDQAPDQEVIQTFVASESVAPNSPTATSNAGNDAGGEGRSSDNNKSEPNENTGENTIDQVVKETTKTEGGKVTVATTMRNAKGEETTTEKVENPKGTTTEVGSGVGSDGRKYVTHATETPIEGYEDTMQKFFNGVKDKVFNEWGLGIKEEDCKPKPSDPNSPENKSQLQPSDSENLSGVASDLKKSGVNNIRDVEGLPSSPPSTPSVDNGKSESNSRD